MKLWSALAVCLSGLLLGQGVAAREISADELTKALAKHPDVLIEAIKANRKAIFAIINQTGVEEQERQRQEAEEAAKLAYEEQFKNPLKPAIDSKSHIRGQNTARLTLVEYADFECPYCASSVAVVDELRAKYGQDIRIVFKNFPLPFHPQAMPAAQWFEAVAMQSPEAAWSFHDVLFKNQDKLGIDFFRKTAASLGVDVKKCEADASSEAVKQRISADIDEAIKFNFDGTPGFLLNGIPVRGAFPVEHFEGIIKKLELAAQPAEVSVTTPAE
ncbi:MAG: hypothetical protein B7Y36_10515 [Novosphingobium sp. 28-62-57]|nr:thioredoxin domain-containing protein [Novosphingobium sp. 28-62-57]OYZ10178.1 MAG: hypothetical protein B7Y36_10515 [Novosphingobium sp. 28-62-57]OZA33585.1 MAG: hypothetical protein B7X92_11155 [Novosphingobium sp. 17-62-9]HQS70372.1 thioredoxin domain-containing protein [Novosphingobium sp.]